MTGHEVRVHNSCSWVQGEEGARWSCSGASRSV